MVRGLEMKKNVTALDSCELDVHDATDSEHGIVGIGIVVRGHEGVSDYSYGKISSTIIHTSNDKTIGHQRGLL